MNHQTPVQMKSRLMPQLRMQSDLTAESSSLPSDDYSVGIDHKDSDCVEQIETIPSQ